jgi:hypothetical protein
MPSCGIIHGHPVYENIDSSGPVQVDDPRPGDIIQFLNAKFDWTEDQDGRTVTHTEMAGAPDHTAVITYADKGCIHVLEQNIAGVKIVRQGTYNLSYQTQGQTRIYRACNDSWAGPCEPAWPT